MWITYSRFNLFGQVHCSLVLSLDDVKLFGGFFDAHVEVLENNVFLLPFLNELDLLDKKGR